jgi:hypothetical protein
MKKKRFLVCGCSSIVFPLFISCGPLPEVEKIRIVLPQPEPKTFTREIKGVNEAFKQLAITIEEIKLNDVLYKELKEPIKHGYQNPRDTITLSSRGKFRRQTKKRKKR